MYHWYGIQFSNAKSQGPFHAFRKPSSLSWVSMSFERHPKLGKLKSPRTVYLAVSTQHINTYNIAYMDLPGMLLPTLSEGINTYA